MSSERFSALFAGARGAAMFIDFENLEGGLQAEQSPDPLQDALDSVLVVRQCLRDTGTRLYVGRAYGSWSTPPTANVSRRFQKNGITAVKVFLQRGKNSADIELSLDAQEALFRNRMVDRFILFGGDRDYGPVARRIHERGKVLIAVGARSAMSDDLLDAIGDDRYFPCHELLARPAPQVDRAALPRYLNPALSLKERVFALLIEKGRMWSEIWVGPFLEKECGAAFPNVDRGDLRDAIDCLKEEGRIAIEKRKDGVDPTKEFSVILIQGPRNGMGMALAQARATAAIS